MSKGDLLNKWKEDNLVLSHHVLKAFNEVERKNFVLSEFIDHAYEDIPLPILEGQTISQPKTVVMMLEELELKEGMHVLEVGAGSGYNAALLAKIVGPKGKIVATEFFSKLVSFAKKNLEKEGIANVNVVQAEKKFGYIKESPYDRIIVAAAAEHVPEELLVQLGEGGILLMPVGSRLGQKMTKISKINGRFVEEKLGDFTFVPLLKKE